MTNPFVFMTSVLSVRLTGRRASNLEDLHAGIEASGDASLYHHTHRFYRSHSFLRETPRSDYAFWVGENLQERALAERLDSLDLRDYASLVDLRTALGDILASARDSGRWTRRVPPGLEFHFCRSVSLVFPTGWTAVDPGEFTEALERVDVGCLYHHLIEAPLHLGAGLPRRNDFSTWLEAGMGRKDLADKVAALDPYRGGLEDLRADLLDLLRPSRVRRAFRGAAERQDPGQGIVADWLRRLRRAD